MCLGPQTERYLQWLYDEQGFFNCLVILDLPRYILQYRASEMVRPVEAYASALS